MLSREFPTSYESHDYELGQTHWICKRCGHAVKQTHHGGTCVGVPIYESWEEIPGTMATKTAMQRDHRKKVRKDQIPVGAKKKYNRKRQFTGHYYPLYAIEDAEDKPEPTPAQLEALKKARHMSQTIHLPCVRCGRAAYSWITRKKAIEISSKEPPVCETCQRCSTIAETCQQWLDSDDTVILDTETTGLYDADAIQIGIIECSKGRGRGLLNTRVQTDKEIEPEASAVHGMTKASLKGAPGVAVVREKLLEHLTDKLVLIYNAAFDQPIIERQFGIEINADCVMQMYSSFIGDWSDYWGNYRWQRLPGGDHSALGDCRATLAVIQEMAEWTPTFTRQTYSDRYDYELIDQYISVSDADAGS